jgi:hypothetical protein
MAAKKSGKREVKLELEGVVRLVEFKGGKRVASEPLDSKLVLDAIRASLASKST